MIEIKMYLFLSEEQRQYASRRQQMSISEVRKCSRLLTPVNSFS